MKKVLFLALAAAAVMSCSESEEIENAGQKAEIKLGTVVGNTTRATVTDLPSNSLLLLQPKPKIKPST